MSTQSVREALEAASHLCKEALPKIEAALAALVEPAAQGARANTLPAIGQPWPGQKGVYAGIARADGNAPDGHLVLLDEVVDEDLDWHEWMKRAAAIGAAVPTRFESALLYANLRDAFDHSKWYWTSTQSSGASAFSQNFYYGHQNDNHKSFKARARFVRRVNLEFLDPPEPRAEAASGEVLITQADIEEARQLIHEAAGTDLLSGERPVKKADRATVYHWLTQALGCLAGVVATPPTPSPEMLALREAFLTWFQTYTDPNIGYVETAIERCAAWAAWKAAFTLATPPEPK